MLECSICFELLFEDKNFLITECGHKFHYSCFKKWDKDTCPMCRQDINYNDEEILINLATLLASNNPDKNELALYLTHHIQGKIDCVPSLYKSLVLYNTRLLVDIMGEPLVYIFKHKLYTLLPYYNYDDYKLDLIKTDDINLVNYIKFDEDILYNIVQFNCINLLNYIIDNNIVTIDGNKVYNLYGNLNDVLQPMNLLGIACQKGYLNLLPILTQYIDINSVNVWNCTALYPAIASRNLAIVKWLVEHGIDINLTHICSNSPLYYAIETRNINMAYYLLNKGAIVTKKHVYACVGYSDNTHLLKKLLSMLPTLELNMTNSFHLCSNRNPNDYIHIDKLYCWCVNCENKGDYISCQVGTPSIFQQVCYYKKFEMILLLLSTNKNIKHYKAELCKLHTLEWYEKLHTLEWREKVIGQFTKDMMTNDLKNMLYSNTRYKTEMKNLLDYIWKLIERDDHVSYKHQRKIVNQKLLDVKNKIWPKSSHIAGLGLYRPYLYNF